MNLDALIPFEQVLEEALRDPEFRAEWDRLAPARAMANRLIAYRAEHGLNQTGSGRVLGVSQPAVARLEAGEHLPSLPTLGCWLLASGCWPLAHDFRLPTSDS
jgi:DNA-binding XRE family transcriptional regulator